jgi:hypothetical protein
VGNNYTDTYYQDTYTYYPGTWYGSDYGYMGSYYSPDYGTNGYYSYGNDYPYYSGYYQTGNQGYSTAPNYVSLNQVPYTGLTDNGTLKIVTFISTLLSISGIASYYFIIKPKLLTSAAMATASIVPTTTNFMLGTTNLDMIEHYARDNSIILSQDALELLHTQGSTTQFKEIINHLKAQHSDSDSWITVDSQKIEQYL